MVPLPGQLAHALRYPTLTRVKPTAEKTCFGYGELLLRPTVENSAPQQYTPADSWGVGRMVRTGVGYDAHRLVMGRTLRLGGVEIPSPRGLAGHSDADVLVHAIMDALLGGAGLGDIGRHFPPSDPAYKDADSIELLRRAASLAANAGWRVLHVDSTVLAEAPRLAPHISKMQERLAAALGVDASAVNIKATTTDGMGAIGRGEGIAAHAVATLCKVE